MNYHFRDVKTTKLCITICRNQRQYRFGRNLLILSSFCLKYKLNRNKGPCNNSIASQGIWSRQFKHYLNIFAANDKNYLICKRNIRRYLQLPYLQFLEIRWRRIACNSTYKLRPQSDIKPVWWSFTLMAETSFKFSF